MVCISACTVIFNTLLAIIVGQFAFGGSFRIIDLMEIIAISLIAILPATAISLIIAIISQYKCNSKIVIGIGMAISLIFGVIDTYSIEVSRFSPIGTLSSFGESIPFLNSNILLNAMGNIIYIIVGLIILLLIANRQDYYE